jgi:hypothetical protein
MRAPADQHGLFSDRTRADPETRMPERFFASMELGMLNTNYAIDVFYRLATRLAVGTIERT